MNHVKEIDGLRAIAVLSVLMFHVGYPLFSGGFVGVDVFFVISGYLITRIILTEIDAGRFSIKRFYERRIRRIVPALVVTLLGCTAFLVIQPPIAAVPIRDGLFAGLLSASNFYFYASTDYFADNSYHPLLHTWSLSVEEQFYFVLPPTLILASLSARSKRLLLLASVTLASLFAAQIVVTHDQSAAFYLPWLRAWELLAGSLLSATRIDAIGAPFKIALTTLGLAAISTACFKYDDRMVFPGLSALLPVLGSCAVIAGTGARSPVHAALGSAPMRLVGKISYSLYLIHWPIVCFVGNLQDVTPKARIAICVASIVLAWLSWKFVETPFRESSRKSSDPAGQRRVFRMFGATVVALGVTFFAMGGLGRALWNSFPEASRYASWLDYQTTAPEFDADTCFLTSATTDFTSFSERCLKLDPTRPNALVVGDSHAAHLMAALRAAYPDIHFLQASTAACKPIRSASEPGVCADMVRFVFDHWLPQSEKALSMVILSARWESSDAQMVEERLASLLALGKTPVLIGPSPEFRAKVPLILAYEQILGRPLAAQLVKAGPRETEEVFRKNLAINPYYVSLIQSLCPDSKCITSEGKVPLYFDKDHLTSEGARVAIRGLGHLRR